MDGWDAVGLLSLLSAEDEISFPPKLGTSGGLTLINAWLTSRAEISPSTATKDYCGRSSMIRGK